MRSPALAMEARQRHGHTPRLLNDNGERLDINDDDSSRGLLRHRRPSQPFVTSRMGTLWQRFRLPSLRCLLALNASLLAALLVLGLLLFTDAVQIPLLRRPTSHTPGSAISTTEAAAAAAAAAAAEAAASPSFVVPIDRTGISAPVQGSASEAVAQGNGNAATPAAAEVSPTPSDIASAAPVAAPAEEEDDAADSDTAAPIPSLPKHDFPAWVSMPQSGAQTAADIPRHTSDAALGAPNAVAHYTQDRHTAFMFPRPAPGSPTSSLFITALPNQGAGVGHQFGEWVIGPWVAMLYNATYLYTGFHANGARWNRFLGFSEGEDTVEDFIATFDPEAGKLLAREPSRQGMRMPDLLKQTKGFKTLVRTMDEENGPTGHVWNWMDNFLATNRRESVARLRQLESEGFVRGLPPTAAHASLDPEIPQPLLVYFDEVHVQASDVLCGPDTRLLQSIRRKYCLARVNAPRPLPDLYAKDRERNFIVVAIHLRCGDSCYETFRVTPFPSVTRTVERLHALLSKLEPDRPLCFHIFSQPPNNGTTAEDHFAPLLASLKGMVVTTHFHASSYVTLHHLVKADVLLGAQSSFSWLAFLLHQGVSIGTFKPCTHNVQYHRDSGNFNEEQFVEEYQNAKRLSPPLKFDSWEECMAIQPHTQVRPLRLDMF